MGSASAKTAASASRWKRCRESSMPSSKAERKVTRQFGGLGLGLAISKSLVELHRGSIGRERRSGQGSTFIVELPEAETDLVGKAPDFAPAESGKQSKMRLLLVEDHHDTARTISRLLRSAGFAVTTATDAASASAAVDREPFDVIVSDLGLPDGDDVVSAAFAQLAVCRALR